MAVAANVFLDQVNSQVESGKTGFEIYLGKFKSSLSIHFINGDKNAFFSCVVMGQCPSVVSCI